MKYKGLILILLMITSLSFVSATQIVIPGVDRSDTIYIVLDNITYNYTSSNYTNSIGFSRVGSTVTLNLERIGMLNLTSSFTDQTTAGNPFDQLLNKSSNVTFNNLNISNELTLYGQLIINGLTISEDIIPDTDSLRSLGNTSIWWDKAYIDNIFAKNINATNINSTNIYSGFVSSDELNSTDINSDILSVEHNVSIGGYKIIKEVNDLVVII